MQREVWFRNPKLYVRELVEQHVGMIAWDRGYLKKYRIDPQRFGDLYYPQPMEYRMLVIGEQGTAEVDRRHSLAAPKAVYPTWLYGVGSMPELERMLATSAGEDPALRSPDPTIPSDERPVFGQEHRVVISDTPNAQTRLGRHFYGILRDLQEDYPDAIIHVHGLYSYNYTFGGGCRSVDMESRTLASKGRIALPMGKEATLDEARKMPHWITLCGFTAKQLEVPRNRCMYNIRSALWAVDNYDSNVPFRIRGRVEVDPDKPDVPPLIISNGVAPTGRTPMVGDKFDCDTCSVQRTCKFFRAGSVCSLPDSDGQKLAKHFKTRNSDEIIDGLGALMATQIERMGEGRSTEQATGELDPEVTKIIDGLFDKGVKLAKLVDPSLTKPGVQVGVQINGQGGITAGQGATPQELAAQAVLALEARGYSRSEMTPALIEAVMTGMPVPSRTPAIEASASDG